MEDIAQAMGLITAHLSPLTVEHSLKVAQYAILDASKRGLSERETRLVFIAALLHDIIEDSDCSYDEICEVFGWRTNHRVIQALMLLTKSKNESYKDYILKIVDSGDEIALAVKRADMKDHLMRQETLTDYLKEKYISTVGYLL